MRYVVSHFNLVARVSLVRQRLDGYLGQDSHSLRPHLVNV